MFRIVDGGVNENDCSGHLAGEKYNDDYNENYCDPILLPNCLQKYEIEAQLTLFIEVDLLLLQPNLFLIISLT